MVNYESLLSGCYRPSVEELETHLTALGEACKQYDEWKAFGFPHRLYRDHALNAYMFLQDQKDRWRTLSRMKDGVKHANFAVGWAERYAEDPECKWARLVYRCLHVLLYQYIIRTIDAARSSHLIDSEAQEDPNMAPREYLRTIGIYLDDMLDGLLPLLKALVLHGTKAKKDGLKAGAIWCTLSALKTAPVRHYANLIGQEFCSIPHSLRYYVSTPDLSSHSSKILETEVPEWLYMNF